MSMVHVAPLPLTVKSEAVEVLLWRTRALMPPDERPVRSPMSDSRMFQVVDAIDGVTVFGPPPGTARTPTVSFHVQGHPSEEVARFLAPLGLYVSNGDFYAAGITRGHFVAIQASCLEHFCDLELAIGSDEGRLGLELASLHESITDCC